jgi:hypothetical protein
MGLALGFQLGVARFRAAVAGGALSAPVCVDIPVITGSPVIGQTLSGSQGVWDAEPTPTFTYQWLRSGADIPGATGLTYTLVAADDGHAIEIEVFATNSQGTNSATSRPVTPRFPAASPATIFAAQEPGIWIDPSILASLFQDVAGTTPVTAVGQPVGLAIDQRQGATLGADISLVTDPFTIFRDATTNTPSPALANVTAGKTYLITMVLSANASTAGASFRLGASSADAVTTGVPANTSPSTLNRYVTCLAAGGLALWGDNTSVDMTIDSVVVREVAGQHAYQNTAAARPVLRQDVGGRNYLSFDGVDDSLLTAIVSPGIDKAQVFAGVNKLSDAGNGAIIEHSDNPATVNGCFSIRSPDANGANTIGTYVLGGTANTFYQHAPHPAPMKTVISVCFDIAGATTPLAIATRVGGKADTSGPGNPISGSLGGGNFANTRMHVGRRNNATLPFNGDIYSIVARFGAPLTAAQIGGVEQWIDQKMGL